MFICRRHPDSVSESCNLHMTKRLDCPVKPDNDICVSLNCDTASKPEDDNNGDNIDYLLARIATVHYNYIIKIIGTQLH